MASWRATLPLLEIVVRGGPVVRQTAETTRVRRPGSWTLTAAKPKNVLAVEREPLVDEYGGSGIAGWHGDHVV